MTARKQIEVREYVDERMKLWEPDIGRTMELQVKKIEELLNDGYYVEMDESMKNDRLLQKLLDSLITKKDRKVRSHNASFINTDLEMIQSPS